MKARTIFSSGFYGYALEKVRGSQLSGGEAPPLHGLHYLKESGRSFS